MVKDADSSFLTLENDQRITRSGKFIRRYRIDELPQIFNILKGEMSLIGPRPVPADFLADYEQKIDNYQMRHRIRPGITGLAQIRQGYTTKVEEERTKLKYDLFYIRSLSYRMDLTILFHSIKAIRKFHSKT
ncbi:sugar transferase [Pedobacter cryoconitis]|uniref:Sugar transferase n=2 Tax=Pedobacter cryoconitis TaxID=188932 RepID=A0A327SDY3_9SPHI|nr:sugar transferase [Pedobacter cryoconitis]